MADVFSFRRVLVSIGLTWTVSIALGVAGVSDYQRGSVAGMVAVGTLWALRSVGYPRG